MATTSLQTISEATALNDSSQEENGGEKLCRVRRQVKPGHVSTISGKHYLPRSFNISITNEYYKNISSDFK